MASNIGTTGAEDLTIVNMKPSGGGVEEINALWGQKMAANDGVLAGDTDCGHIRYAQGTLIVAQDSTGTAFLTRNSANGGIPIFTCLPSISIAQQDFVSGIKYLQLDAVDDTDNQSLNMFLPNDTAGTMLCINRWSNEPRGTCIWTALGI